MKYLALFSLVILTACSAATDRYVVPPAQTQARQGIAFRAVEIREVSLPAYASDDEIVRLGPEGRLRSDGVLWADTPDRAVALELTRHLAQITRARVASNPWPFEGLPDARLDIRFESLVAGADGRYRATGQYFVAVADGRRERSGLFDLGASFDPAGGPAAVARARADVILQLAEFLARRALR